MKDQRLCIAFDQGERTRGYVEYARTLDLRIKLVDCHADNIMQQLSDVDALVWHWTHGKYEDKRNAKNVLAAASQKGILVYPDLRTCFTFDDKVAQKYLMEAIGAPFIETHVFFDQECAERWIEQAEYPIVHKLAGGASSTNVALVRSKKEAVKICKSRFKSHKSIKEIFGKKTTIKEKVKYFIWGNNERYMGMDKGYVLFQEFLGGNQYDIRVTIIGEKAVIFRRYVRDNDFRASGSGKIDYNVSNEDMGAISIGFMVADKLQSQTLALDLIYATDRQLKIIEISYGFVSKAVENAGGYYDRKKQWHDESLIAEREVIDGLMAKAIEREKKSGKDNS